MELGKFFRQSVSDFLANPLILLPFAVIGILSTGLGIFYQYYLSASLGVSGSKEIVALLSSPASITPSLVAIFSKFFLIVVLSSLFLSFISSFSHAFSIGIAGKIAHKKKPVIADGMQAVDSGFAVFSFKVLLWVFSLLGAIILAIPAALLFGIFGVLMSAVFIFFFIILLQFAGFFGKQAIVLEGLNAWAALQRSYRVIRKNFENVLLLILIYLFFSAGFFILKEIFTTLANYLVSGAGSIIFTHAANFVFAFLIMSPLFVIIKTSYFVRKAQLKH